MISGSVFDTSKVRKQYFLHHHPTTARLNHGSFGSVPECVLRKQGEYQNRWLSNPDRVYYDTLLNDILESNKLVADIINADSEEVQLVENATAGTVIALQRWQEQFWDGTYKKGEDAVLLLDVCYGAVRKIAEHYLERAGARVVLAQIPFPIASPAEALNALEEVLKREQGRVKLAVLDHVSSLPSILFPLKEMVRMCHDYDVKEVFVDGAHAIGSVEIDVKDIDAEYYTSNLHKWLFCPAGVAFLHVKAELKGQLHHPMVSHNYDKGLPKECAWVGTGDYTRYLCVGDALKFVEKMGGIQAIAQFNRTKVLEMAQMLAEAWGSQIAQPPEMVASLVMIPLPESIRLHSQQAADALRSRLHNDFDVEAVIYAKDGRAYTRLAHQIYNTGEEYDRFREAVLAIAAESAQK